MQRRRKRWRVGLVVRVLLGALVVAAVVTDIADPWIVPFAERPYGDYRADLVGDIGEAADLGALAGRLRLESDAVRVDTWIKPRR